VSTFHFPILPLITILKINYFIIIFSVTVFFNFFYFDRYSKNFFKQLFYLTTILKLIIYILKINIIDFIN